MYIFWIIWCLAAVWVLAKFDKKLTIKVGGKIEKSDRWDDLLDYYNGRVTIYKVLFVVSLIPFVNAFIATIASIITVLLIGVFFAKSSFWQKGFWNKIF
jgi:hypothetical protein